MKESPNSHAWRDRFPQARMIAGFEGGAVYEAEDGDQYFLIIDEGVMAGFLLPEEDSDLLASLVKVMEFDSFDERSACIAARCWRANPANGSAL